MEIFGSSLIGNEVSVPQTNLTLIIQREVENTWIHKWHISIPRSVREVNFM